MIIGRVAYLPAFRFTEWLVESDPALKAWLEYFKFRGRPAGIVSRGKHPQYSLWVLGKEWRMSLHGGSGHPVLTDPDEGWLVRDYRIVKSVHNFEEVIHGELAKRVPAQSGAGKSGGHQEGKGIEAAP